MRKNHHIISPILTSHINLILSFLIKSGTGETISNPSIFAQECTGSYQGTCCGGSESHKSNVYLSVTDDTIRLEDRAIGTEIAKIGTDYGSIQTILQFEELRHTEIELMVSQSHHIIPHFIHNSHDVLSFRERTHHIALDEIATGNGRNIGSQRLLLFLQCREFGISIDGTMHIIIENNDDGLIGSIGNAHASLQSYQRSNHQQQNSCHCTYSLLITHA